MATNAFVEINIEEAAHLADLTGIVHDFERTKHFAEQLKEMIEGGIHPVHEPMTIAILIRYSRPFVSGVRYHLNERDLEELSPEQRAAHDGFILWRNKHIAHSVNVFEENQPVARYWVERFDSEGFSSVECNSTELAGMSLYDVEMVMELTTHFIEKLKPRLKCEKKKVLEIVQSLKREDVLVMAKPASVSNMKDVGKVRKQRSRQHGQ
jgi:hypothetical protein